MEIKFLKYCRSNNDLLKWFEKTPPWNTVSPKIITTIIDQIPDRSNLELFIQTSFENDLIQYFEKLGRTSFRNSTHKICHSISEMHSARGSDAADKYFKAKEEKPDKKEWEELLNLALNSFKCSIFISDSMIRSYMLIVLLLASEEKYKEAIDCIDSAFNALHSLGKKPLFIDNALPECPEQIDEMEKFFLEIKEVLQNKWVLKESLV